VRGRRRGSGGAGAGVLEAGQRVSMATDIGQSWGGWGAIRTSMASHSRLPTSGMVAGGPAGQFQLPPADGTDDAETRR